MRMISIVWSVIALAGAIAGGVLVTHNVDRHLAYTGQATVHAGGERVRIYRCLSVVPLFITRSREQLLCSWPSLGLNDALPDRYLRYLLQSSGNNTSDLLHGWKLKDAGADRLSLLLIALATFTAAAMLVLCALGRSPLIVRFSAPALVIVVTVVALLLRSSAPASTPRPPTFTARTTVVAPAKVGAAANAARRGSVRR